MTDATTGNDRGTGKASALLRVSLLLGRLMLRTDQSPLRAVWLAFYTAVIHACALFVRWKRPGATVYVKGSFAFGDPLCGVSDVDVISVVPGEPGRPEAQRTELKQHWARLIRRLPPLAQFVQHWVYEKDELHAVLRATSFTYGLDERAAGSSPGPAGFEGSRRLNDDMSLLDHPSLYGSTREWRRVVGRDVRRAEPDDAQHRRLVAWLELQFWWRWAFEACAEPQARHVPYLCFKLVAEPVRILLWLAHGERLSTRRAVLERAIRLMPDEVDALRRALELRRQLPRSPDAPLTEFLPYLVRLSAKIGGHIASSLEGAGESSVRLRHGPLALPEAAEPNPKLFPLVDWRARTRPLGTEETFALVPGDVRAPDHVGAAALAGRTGPYPALQAGRLLVFPAASYDRANLRAIQIEATDPVSFALLDGRELARFPGAAGWSVRDSALRAVAEHGAWLGSSVRTAASDWDGLSSKRRTELTAMLFSAARAALLLASVDAGEPELTTTLSAAAESLGERSSSARGVAEEAFGAYRDAALGGDPPPASAFTALLELVGSLPQYAASAAG